MPSAAQLFARCRRACARIGVSARGDAAARRCAPRTSTLDADRHRASTCDVDGERIAVRSPLLGRFNVDNLLAVAGVLLALG